VPVFAASRTRGGRCRRTQLDCRTRHRGSTTGRDHEILARADFSRIGNVVGDQKVLGLHVEFRAMAPSVSPVDLVSLGAFRRFH